MNPYNKKIKLTQHEKKLLEEFVGKAKQKLEDHKKMISELSKKRTFNMLLKQNNKTKGRFNKTTQANSNLIKHENKNSLISFNREKRSPNETAILQDIKIYKIDPNYINKSNTVLIIFNILRSRLTTCVIMTVLIEELVFMVFVSATRVNYFY